MNFQKSRNLVTLDTITKEPGSTQTDERTFAQTGNRTKYI